MVRILCEGKDDRKFLKKFIQKVLNIKSSNDDFIIMGSKANFFKANESKYHILDVLVTAGKINRLLFVLDSDNTLDDSKYGGYKNSLDEIKKIISQQGWGDISDVHIMCDPDSKIGNCESLILSTIPEHERQCVYEFLKCSKFQDIEKDKEVVRRMLRCGYPEESSIYNFNHQNFSELKTKLQTLFTTED